MAHEQQHTPGPWVCKEQGEANQYCLITNDNHWVIALQQNGRMWTEEQQANAKLIAAAPDLLEALENLHKAAWDNGCSAQLSDELKKAKAAINKATL